MALMTGHAHVPKLCSSELTSFSISLSVTFVPCKTVCLLSVLLAQALADDAFEVHFPSVETLLNRPKLRGNVDYMPLKWKAEMLDGPILPITYNKCWQIRNKTTLRNASGSRRQD